MPSNGNELSAEPNNKRSRLVDRRSFLAATGSGAAVTLAGCMGGGGGGTIKIGGVYLLSGLAEALGAGSKAAAEVAVDVINEEGGINGKDVEIQVRDHGENPQQQLRSLVQEFGADVMIGLTSSGVTLNSGPTIKQLGVPFTLTDIGTPFITEHNTEKYGNYYKSDTGKAAGVPNLFRTNTNTSIQTHGIAKYVSDNYSQPRIANMGPDYAYGQQVWKYIKAYLDGYGVDYKVVASEFPSLGASNMTPQINTVMNAEPDIVFQSFWAGDTVTFTNQAAEQGLFKQVEDVHATISGDATNFAALGDTTPEGVHYNTWYWPGAYGTEADKRFIKRYKEKYKDNSDVLAFPTFTGGSTWAAIWVYKQAIEAAGGTKPDDVINQMEGLTFKDDPRGEITLDKSSHQARGATAIIGETSFDVDVPYDGAGLTNTTEIALTREKALKLLEGSGLPPGV